MMLSRIYEDVRAFIGKTGNEQEDSWDCRYRNKKFGLGGKSLEETIAELKKRWNVIPDDLKPKMELVNRKPILPSEEELEENNRSHSAKLRVARKIHK